MRVSGLWQATLLYTALTAVAAYPLSVHLVSRMLPLGPDGHLVMWTLSWDVHALVHQPWSIFDANIYFPQHLTLAYSENLLGSAVLAAPVLWLTGNPVLALNLVSLLSVVLCGLGTYLLARRLGLGTAGALLTGLIFAFSPPRFFRLGQLHLTTVEWIPFSLAYLHAYLDGGRARDVRLALAFFTLQALTSGHGAVFLLVAAAGLVAYRTALGEPLNLSKRLRDVGVPGLLLVAPAVLVTLPYWVVQREMGLRRTLVDWGIVPTSFIASPAHAQRWLLSLLPGGDRIVRDADAYLFPGWLPLVLALGAVWRRREPPSAPSAAHARGWTRAALILEVAALAGVALALVLSLTGPARIRVGGVTVFSAHNAWRAWSLVLLVGALRWALRSRVPLAPAARLATARDRIRRWAEAHRRNVVWFYGLLTLLCVWLAIGPPFGLWQYVYWLPGLDFIRAPSRFTILGLLGLAILGGIGFERMARRLSPARRRTAALIVGALLMAEFAAMPLDTIPFRADPPEVDRWLATQPTPFVVAEVPLPSPANAGAFERRQTAYMLHSMAHWQKTVHGYSGLRPPFYDVLYREMRGFPDERSLDRLAGLGVTFVVVHTDLYDAGEWPEVERRIHSFQPWLTLVHRDGAGRVYALKRPPEHTQLTGRTK